MSKDTVVRLYDTVGGALTDLEEEFSVNDDLGGTLPMPGDLIVDPGVPTGADRREPTDRTVYEVKARYFRPDKKPRDGIQYVVLVVGIRPGDEEERDLF